MIKIITCMPKLKPVSVFVKYYLILYDFICYSHFMIRKTVILEEDIVQQVNLLAKKEDRDFSGCLRHALRIGLLALQNPELTAREIKDILEAKVEMEAGLLMELGLADL
jgi:hypothetical protein